MTWPPKPKSRLPSGQTLRSLAADASTRAYEAALGLLALTGPEDTPVDCAAAAELLVAAFGAGEIVTWPHFADEAEYHGIAPLLAGILDQLPDALVPTGERRIFRILARRHERAAIAREACIDLLIEACDRAGVQMLLLKGAALAHVLYSRPPLRPMADIDILVGSRQAEIVMTVARRLGYSFGAGYGTRFAVELHHLPAATICEGGFTISLEIHLDAMSPNQADSLTSSCLSGPPQSVMRPSGRPALAFGHTDMLRHLSRHAFEPVKRIRLIHLLDLWRYQHRFGGDIDWREIAARFPHVIVALRLASGLFGQPELGAGPLGRLSCPMPDGAGLGMLPLSDIAAGPQGGGAALHALFNPPAFWLHGFYGVPPDHSLLDCRLRRHPATLARWLWRRARGRLAWSLGARPRSIASQSGQSEAA